HRQIPGNIYFYKFPGMREENDNKGGIIISIQQGKEFKSLYSLLDIFGVK
ncbi:unnamed protein product, partial [marine sediment metagenome]